jgi:TolB protein
VHKSTSTSVHYHFYRWWILTAAIGFIFTTIIIFASREILSASDQIAFETDRNGSWDIYLLDVRTRIAFNLTHHTDDDFAPSWSPDGKELIFYSDRTGNHRTELYILNIETLETRAFTDATGDYRRAVWSPDGHQIVYTIGYGQLHLAASNGMLIRPLGYGFSPTWSPDGRWIIYYADSQNILNAEIYALNVVENRVLNLTRHIANDWSPAWSPNGDAIAFVSSRDGNAELYLIENICLVVTTNNCNPSVRRLTYNASNDSSPAWSPDGKRLVYEVQQGADTDLFVIDVETLETFPLYSTPANERHPAWRPR